MRSRGTPVEQRRELTKEECEAALKGNVAFLNEQLDSLGMDFLVSQTPREGNILHELIQSRLWENDVNKAKDFTKRAIQLLPSLLSQQDRNGNTLVHLIFYSTREIFAAYDFEYGTKDLLMMVQREALDHAKDGLCRLKNVKGDTALHVAVRTEHYDFAIRLLEVDSEVARLVNNRNQTPLHLLSFRNSNVFSSEGSNSEAVDELISCLINANANQPYMQDEDGLTPLLTAVQQRNLGIFKQLLKRFPASAEIADFKGRTFWHWFGSQYVERFPPLLSEVYQDSSVYKEWLSIRGDQRSWRLMGNKDNEGNTPLHLAIANQQFCFAHFYIDCYGDAHTIRYSDILLEIDNKKGVSSFDLIGSAEHLPLQFEKFLAEKVIVPLSGHRSMYGIPTTKMEAYTNTIGVIAALLATITFTAAFTVPGGLDSGSGTPLLLRKAMFQVFMVADMVAMCLSVMVLFCLLWIMTTGNKKESISLLDLSVFLLQTSFYATLVTFMTGLYVTTISIVPAIAISTCVVCSLLIILMHKRLVMLTIVPVFRFLVEFFSLLIRDPRFLLYILAMKLNCV